jgi:hypothetical protein
MKSIVNNVLKATFIVDAIMAIGFGLYSWFSPYETFGTIISIPEMDSAAFLAILSSISLFYILLGLTCLIGFKATFPISFWIGLLMICRHLLEGLMKISDIGKEWLIGNPYPDIIIHSIFAIYITYKNHQAVGNTKD